ncbi:MAG TPA: Do family serine endopeptidase [Candidatus Binataceae bacterium]|nr:Do family serine endopeptidase [Candidatus Binataceae bacterium]
MPIVSDSSAVILPRALVRLAPVIAPIIAMACALLLLAVHGAAAGQLWSELAVRRKVETLPDFVGLSERLSPAVVNVATEQNDKPAHAQSSEGNSDPFDLFGQPFEPYAMPHVHSVGSGFIINRDGYILTNDHVVEDASRVVVTLKDGHEYKARVIGRDSKTDIALLKIDAPYPLPIVPLGNSDAVRVGEWVMAIGNPFGFDHSVTAGIVSAKGRFIPGSYDEYIQTDASINPGNSGGPLIGLAGEVVGVNAAIFTRTGSSMGIGFAIPVNLVKDELPELQSLGRVQRGWLGVYIEPVTEGAAGAAGLDVPHGAMVSEVIDNSPAKTAGLRHGDIIVAIDRRPVDQAQELPLMVAAIPVGRRATLTVMRGRTVREVPIAITASHENELASAASDKPVANSAYGLALMDLNASLGQELSLNGRGGVVITSVEPNGAAATAGLRPRDIILEVDRKRVSDVVSCQQALGGANGNILLLLIKRNGGTLFVPLRHRADG